MPSEAEILAKIWCMSTPKDPVARVFHAGCLAYLESKKLIRTIDFTALPTETHFQIIRKLPYVNRLSLKETNHLFRYIVTAFHTHKELLFAELEDHAKQNDLLACKFCLRLRSKSKFADTMRTGKTGCNGRQRYRRFCLDCGIQNKIYVPRNLLLIDAIKYIMCSDCRKFKRWDEFTRFPRVDKDDQFYQTSQSFLGKCLDCVWKTDMKALMKRKKTRKGAQNAYIKPE